MAGKSDYLENKVLDHVLRNTAYTPAATIYVGLYTAAPSDSGGGTELSGNGYSRQSCAFSAASGGATANSGSVTFGPNTTANWGTVTHFGLFDASSGGNLLYWGALASSKVVEVGDSLVFGAGDLDVTED